MQIRTLNADYVYVKTQPNNEQNTQESDTKQNKEQEKELNELSAQEQSKVRELQATDTKVKAHEMAHMSAGGGLAGGASYTYTRGPDNKMYAVAGEVPISMPHSSNPDENIANARRIQAAALAPSDPSPQDYKVAASAMRMEIDTRAELVKMKAQENKAAQEKAKEQQESAAENSANLNKNDTKAEQTNSQEKKAQIIASYTSQSPNSSFNTAA